MIGGQELAQSAGAKAALASGARVGTAGEPLLRFGTRGRVHLGEHRGDGTLIIQLTLSLRVFHLRARLEHAHVLALLRGLSLLALHLHLLALRFHLLPAGLGLQLYLLAALDLLGAGHLTFNVSDTGRGQASQELVEVPARH
jgi:hypothetical protein